MKAIDLNSPPDRKKAVLWHICGGWITNFVLIAQGILLVPLYIHFLGDRLYGFWLASGGILAWLSMVNLGVSAVTKQRCAAAYARREMSMVKNYFYHGAVVMSLIVLVFGFSLWWAGSLIRNWLAVDPEFVDLIQACFYVAGFSVIGRLLNEFAMSLAVSLQRNRYAMLAGAIGDICALICIIVLLVVYNFGLWSIVIGMLIRTFLPLVLNAFYAARLCAAISEEWSPSKVILKDYFKTMPSMVASIASGSFTNNLPVILITRWIGPEATVAFSVTQRVVLIVQSFINHAQAGLYTACTHYFNDSTVTKERLDRMMAKLSRGFIVASVTALALYGFLNQGFVSVWTSSEQFAGQFFTAAVALASFFVMRSKLFVGFGVAVGSIQQANLYRCVENLLAAVFMFIGIYSMGMIGAPLAIVVSSLISEFMYYHMFREQHSSVYQSFGVLRWGWALLVILLVLAQPLSVFFDAGNWFHFLLRAGILGLPAGLAFIWLMPDLKSQLTLRVPFLRKFGLSV
ncbi:lipopolysaccharide biosynthesis protein [Coraliomargarita sp. W4R53]